MSIKMILRTMWYVVRFVNKTRFT